ncbi:unnamed protein product [Sphagnum balticum]
MYALLKPLKAKFSYPNEFRTPAREMEFSGMEVDVIGTFYNASLSAGMRLEYGECLMVCKTPAGDEFLAFETELEMAGERELKTVVFLAVRSALYAPAHPDSKRQARRKQRDLTRYGARVLKQDHVTSCPPVRTNKRHELRHMRERMEIERKEYEAQVTARLLGRKPKGETVWEWK